MLKQLKIVNLIQLKGDNSLAIESNENNDK